VRRIFAKDDKVRMPPPDSNLRLTGPEKALLKRWIALGADYGEHWSFRPVAAVAPPAPANAAWARNPVDAFLLARLEAEGLAPSPEAAPETLLRRLAFCLTGLPPTIAELDAFLSDPSPDAWSRAIDRYLASPAYGEHMALDWLDLSRYADTYGYQSDVDRDMSPWRDWVIRAFNENLRYDEFLRWQLAGDLTPGGPDRDQRIATAFNRLHRQTNEGGSIDEEFRVEYVADRVATFGTAMLGLTLGCARCHDHKFDPISQRDFYSLSAFFDNIDESGLYSHFTRATPTPALPLWPEGAEARHAEIRREIAAAEEELRRIAREAQNDVGAGRPAPAAALPPPVAHFDFAAIADRTTPDRVSGKPAAVEDGVEPVADGLPPGVPGRALRFSGDSQVVCRDVGAFRRVDPFSLGLWIRPDGLAERAVVLHRSRAWTDSGSRGYELRLDRGRPFFALIHFWPGNAAAVRATRALPDRAWSHLTATYDGSSRADGLRLYLDGEPLETEVVRDRLTRDIVHRAEWGDMDVGNIHLVLGARFRDSGFRNGMLADVRVFDVALTAPEARLLAAGGAPAATLEHTLARHHEPYRAAAAALRRLRERENDLVNDVPEIMVMEEMPVRRPTHLLRRGAYDEPGDAVSPDTPSHILPFPDGAPRNRLGLARWLLDRRNPLTARVAVNRIWMMHFGRGLVATPEDFGSQGSQPSHPELLDWLAGWFMDRGWDVKALHRLLLDSAAFRQSSRASRELLERDQENRLLARGPKRRLPAEEIRDAALAASGLLNRAVGGPSVKPYQPAGLWEQSGTGKTYVQDRGDKLYRRSLYTFWRRTAPPPSMLAFDAVPREVCSARRETTATPLQSLVLLNDPQFVEAARALGEALLRKHPADAAARVREAFRALTGRAPDAAEAEILGRLYAGQREFYAGDPAAAAKLLGVGESKRDEALPPAESAAMTAAAGAILGHDEFVTLR
jgi:hypothetical protein